MAVNVASNGGVRHPVGRRAFDAVERDGVEDVDAVEDVGSRLCEREVRDVQDGDGSQDASLDEVSPRPAQLERVVDPKCADGGGNEEGDE